MEYLKLVESAKTIQALAPILPSSAAPRRVSLKDYGRVTVIISAKNTTSVTGAAITLKQATDVAGTDEKSLSFDTVWINDDTDSSDTQVETDVSSDTFTLTTDASKNIIAQLEISAESLDSDNGFDVFSVDIADAVAQVVDILYILRDARYKQALMPSAITD